MGRNKKYEEALLLFAVTEYAKITGGKIVATELARWASDNVEGLKGVRDYHFTRPEFYKETSRGKTKKADRASAQKIAEINLERSLDAKQASNELLSAVNVERFFELSRSQQEDRILQTRALFAESHQRIKKAEKEINRVKTEVERLSAKYEQYISFAQRAIKELEEEVAMRRAFEKTIRTKMKEDSLVEMGVHEGYVSLVENTESLRLNKRRVETDLKEAMELYAAIYDEEDFEM